MRRFAGRLLLLPCLAALLACATLAVAQDYNLPTLGEPANTTLSPDEEQRLGGRVVAQLLQAGRIIEDVELNHYLQQVGQRLVRATDHSPDKFKFFVIDSSTINAFALPGGYIGVNAGLILETHNESELAGVMAHEISHVTQRHIARQIEATRGLQWATLAAMLAAAIIAGGDGDAMQAAITGGISVAQQQRISYTRAHELEADRIGIRLLAKADYDPDAMASFFETMQRHSRLYGKQLPQILLTHPVNNTRIAEARARAADYPTPSVVESDDYAIMKERARVLSHNQRSAVLDYYRRIGAPKNTPPAVDYGYAITLARVGEARQAAHILQALAQSHPQQWHYAMALARAQAQSGQMQAALATLDALERTGQRRPAVALAYAGILLDSGQLQAARDYLTDRPHLLQQSANAQKLLARAAGMQGDLGEAYYRQALYHRLRMAYVPAIRRLRTALHATDLASLDRQRLEALLDQIIDQCKAAWPNGECSRRVLRQQSY